MPEPSILDARLAEIDRRLRTIQFGLGPPSAEAGSGESAAPAAGAAPAGGAAPGAPPPPPPPAAPAAPAASPAPGTPAAQLADLSDLIAELRDVVAAHQRLLASARELLTTFADTLARTPPPPRPAEVRPLRAVTDPPAAPVGVAVGPFTDTGALRLFEQRLAALPEVRSVTLREFAGDDRAIVDVELGAG